MAEVAALRLALAPVSEEYLRRLLRECGYPLAPMVEGVRQSSWPEMERTLLQLQQCYEAARDAGEQRAVRQVVLRAREVAELALRKRPEDTTWQERLLWLREWLENPVAFGLWLALRKQVLAKSQQ